MRRPVVVKFGGSLFRAPERDGLLAAAARHGAVVAPGGGPFADAVRAEQRRLGFTDAAAHEMAILAMDQAAVLLAEAGPGLLPCVTPADFRRAAEASLGAVWRPSSMALGAALPASWDVTSDSLALWLAIELGAARLLILKASSPPADTRPGTWAAAGLVDRHFPILAARFAGEITVLAPATAAGLDHALGAALKSAA